MDVLSMTENISGKVKSVLSDDTNRVLCTVRPHDPTYVGIHGARGRAKDNKGKIKI